MESSSLPTAYRLPPAYFPFNNPASASSHTSEDARGPADGMVDRQTFDRLMLAHLDRAPDEVRFLSLSQSTSVKRISGRPNGQTYFS